MKEKMNPVFVISLILCVGVALWAVVFNESFSVVANAAFTFLTTDFGWLYMIAMAVFMVFVLVIAFSKYGKIKLGPDDSTPEYSTLSWFAMLFGCGMGVGLVFWGVAEPISHFVSPIAGVEPGTPEAAAFAMKSAFMHWGFQPWANYAIIGLALAYFQFRKNRPGLISTCLEPLIGEKGARGPIGKFVDILAIFATIAGVVTSLGLGVMQINSGLNMMFGVPSNLLVQIVIVILVTIIVVASAVSGIEKGIKAISDINLYIAIFVLAACFIIGPKIDIVNNIVSGTGAYIQNIVIDSLNLPAYGDNSWTLGWRIFYWAWFIAWAPFVGVFIARISKGRTIREFIGGVVVVPAVASILWFGVFGSMGLSLGIDGEVSMDTLASIAAAPETGLFTILPHYFGGFALCVVALVLLLTFFITSANSGTFVLGMLSSDGDMNPTSAKKILWGAIQAAMAIGLLIAGGLKPVQTISIVAAAPFIIVMFAVMVSIVKALAKDPAVTGEVDQAEEPKAIEAEGAAETV